MRFPFSDPWSISHPLRTDVQTTTRVPDAYSIAVAGARQKLKNARVSLDECTTHTSFVLYSKRLIYSYVYSLFSGGFRTGPGGGTTSPFCSFAPAPTPVIRGYP